MVAAIENLPEPQKGGRRILVFAPMAELGAFSREAHERVAKAALKAADHFLCLGKSYPGGKRFEKLEALASHLQAFLREGDVVLIKGSRAYEMEKIFALLNPARGYHKP